MPARKHNQGASKHIFIGRSYMIETLFSSILLLTKIFIQNFKIMTQKVFTMEAKIKNENK